MYWGKSADGLPSGCPKMPAEACAPPPADRDAPAEAEAEPPAEAAVVAQAPSSGPDSHARRCCAPHQGAASPAAGGPDPRQRHTGFGRSIAERVSSGHALSLTRERAAHVKCVDGFERHFHRREAFRFRVAVGVADVRGEPKRGRGDERGPRCPRHRARPAAAACAGGLRRPQGPSAGIRWPPEARTSGEERSVAE